MFRNTQRQFKFYRKYTMKKDKYISIRCTEEVKDYLNSLAEPEDRSLSSQILHMRKQTSPQLALLMKKPRLADATDLKKAELHPDLS